MNMKTKKIIRVTVELSVNKNMTAAEARREVRSLINDQCYYSWDDDDIRAKSVRPAAPKSRY